MTAAPISHRGALARNHTSARLWCMCSVGCRLTRTSHTDRPMWMSRYAITKTAPASWKARGMAAFMNRLPSITASSIVRVREPSHPSMVTVHVVYA